MGDCFTVIYFLCNIIRHQTRIYQNPYWIEDFIVGQPWILFVEGGLILLMKDIQGLDGSLEAVLVAYIVLGYHAG